MVAWFQYWDSAKYRLGLRPILLGTIARMHLIRSCSVRCLWLLARPLMPGMQLVSSGGSCCSWYTLASRFGRTSPQGSFTGSASDEGIFKTTLSGLIRFSSVAQMNIVQVAVAGIRGPAFCDWSGHDNRIICRILSQLLSAFKFLSGIDWISRGPH